MLLIGAAQGRAVDAGTINTAVETYLTDNPPSVSNGSITNAKLADAPEGTFKGRLLGSGAGTPVDLTPTQARTVLDVPQTTRAIATQHSLTGGGTLAADRTLSLVGDTAAPGASKVYGTDGAGARGWKDDPAGGLSAQAEATLVGRAAGAGTGTPTALTATQGRAVLDVPQTTRAIATQHSLTGGGNLSADRTLNLVGDTASPGASKLYGTNGSGVRGWYDQPAGGTLTPQAPATLLGRASGAGTGTPTALTDTQVRDAIKLEKRPQDYGAVADGTSRPVSQWLTGGALDRGYADLAAIRVDYPHVTTTSDEIDWAAGQKALASASQIFFPAGTYRINRPYRIQSNTRVYGEGPTTIIRNTGAGSTQQSSCWVIGAHHPTVWNPSNSWAHIIYPGTIAARTFTFSVAAKAGDFAAGEMVWFRSQEYEGQTSGNFIPEYIQLNQVIAVNTGANTVTLRDPIDETVDNPAIAKFSSTADPTKVDPSTGSPWYACENVILENMALDSTIGLSDRTCAYNAIIRNLKFFESENAIVINALVKSTIEDCEGTFSDRAIEVKNGASDLTIRRVSLTYQDNGSTITIPIINTGENARNIIFDRCNVFCGADFTANVRMLALNQRGGGVYNSKLVRLNDGITTEMYAIGTPSNWKYGTERVEIIGNEFVAGAGTNSFFSIGALISTSSGSLSPPSGCTIGPNKHVGGSTTAVGGTHAITRGFQKEANRIYANSGPTAITFSSTQQPPIPMADDILPSTGIANLKVAENGWNLPSQDSNKVGFKARGRRVGINGGNGSSRFVVAGGSGQFDAWRDPGTGYIVCRPGFSLRPSSGITWTQVGGTSEYYAPRTAATGTFTFTAQPADHSNLYINGRRFTFVPNGTTPVGEYQIQKGTSLANTITAAAAALNACTDSRVNVATYTATSGTVLTVTHDVMGTFGNQFTLGRQTSGFLANCSVSASTLTGGTGPSVTALPARVVDGDGADGATEDELYENGVVGSLTSGKYGYGDPASLGYSTIVVRMRDDVDPDTRGLDALRWVPSGVTIEAATTVTTGGVSGGAVNSVFGRAGDVDAESGDYSADLISAGATATNYTPSSGDVAGHLSGIDNALGTGPTLTANQYPAVASSGSSTEGRTDKRGWAFAAPITANGTYPIALWSDVPITHSQISAATTGGSCSIKIQKGGVDINGFGTAVALTTTRTDTTSTESFAANNVITLVVSGATSLTGIYVTGKAVRTGN